MGPARGPDRRRGVAYIDFLTGWCVGNLGWGNPKIRSAMSRFKGPDYVHPHQLYRPWTDLAERLLAIAPGRLRKCYRTTGGTESVEAALLMSQCATGRSMYMSVEGSYHGNSTGALSVAAFIMEPIIINMGVLVPEREFMSGLRILCRKYGTLLIMDEVATGFGRTGRLFASEHFDIEPDNLCLSKALSGGYAGIGAVLATKDVAEAVEGKLSHYSTYGWHPRSVAAALANLDYWKDHGPALLANASALESLVRDRLEAMMFGQAPMVRASGAAIGVEFEQAGYATKLQERCLRKGLVLDAEGSLLWIFPALTMEWHLAEKGLDILESCLK